MRMSFFKTFEVYNKSCAFTELLRFSLRDIRKTAEPAMPQSIAGSYILKTNICTGKHLQEFLWRNPDISEKYVTWQVSGVGNDANFKRIFFLICRRNIKFTGAFTLTATGLPFSFTSAVSPTSPGSSKFSTFYFFCISCNMMHIIVKHTIKRRNWRENI